MSLPAQQLNTRALDRAHPGLIPADPSAAPRVERVLALASAASISGPGRQLAALAQRLTARGIDLRIVLLRRPGASEAYEEHLRTLGVTHEVVTDRGPLDRGVVRAVTHAIKRFDPHIVQTHGYKATAVAWALRRSGLRTPWVGCFHGSTTESLRARFYHQLDQLMLGAADKIVVMSDQQAHQFRRYRPRVQIIQNALVPLTTVPPTPDHADRIANRLRALARPRLGVVARLSPEKGVDVFLNACRLLVARGIDFTGVIAGDGPDRARLERIVRSSGLDERIEFLGHVDAVAVVYAEIDVLILPSRSEGLPNTLLEALGMDLRVVATQVGAVPDVLSEPGAGRMVPADSPHELATAIESTLREDPAHGRTMRSTTVARFSLERRADLHLALYRALLNERATTAQ